jgi:hypothetical protein
MAKRKIVGSKAQKFFKRLEQLVDNEYWQDQFRGFSEGNFPKGFKFEYEEEPTIIFRYGKANYREALSRSANEALVPLIEFLCKHGSFKPLEIPQVEDPEPVPPSDDWRDYKKIGRTQLLQRYVDTLQQRYQLSDHRASELRSVLLTSSKQKLIKPDHVHMEEGQIVNISVLKIRSENDYRFDFNYDTKTTKPKSKEDDPGMKAMITLYQYNRMKSKSRRKNSPTYMTTES